MLDNVTNEAKGLLRITQPVLQTSARVHVTGIEESGESSPASVAYHP